MAVTMNKALFEHNLNVSDPFQMGNCEPTYLADVEQYFWEKVGFSQYYTT